MLPVPIEDTIRKRTSWRSYNGSTLSLDDRQAIESYISSDLKTPFGNKPKFHLIDYIPGERKLGTYGFIQGAKHFVVGSINNASMSIEDYGYVMEKIILYATNLNLGTCWLGGTFNKSGFAKSINLSENEFIPAVTPLGYGKEQRQLIGKLIRWGAGSRNRNPWDQLFFNPDWTPFREINAGEYSKALEMVRIGPSASNGQPWRIVIDDEMVHFYLKIKPGYGAMNRLDIGIAICHFELSMGSQGKWVIRQPSLPSKGLNYVATWTK